jgi:hypothetical protein
MTRLSPKQGSNDPQQVGYLSTTFSSFADELALSFLFIFGFCFAKSDFW